MRNERTLVAGALALAVGASAWGAEGARPGQPGRGRRDAAERLTRVLGLDETQRRALTEAMTARQPELDALRLRMRDVRQQLQTALAAENPDPQNVGALVIRQKQLLDEGRALRAEADAALRPLLSPAQQSKLDLLESMRPAFAPIPPPAAHLEDGPPPDDGL